MQTAGIRGFSPDSGYIFVVVLGLFIGSFIGNMAEIVPYGVTLLVAIAVAVLTWRQDGEVSILVIMLGLFVGSAFGTISGQIPLGLTFFLGILIAVSVFRTQGGGASIQGPSSAMALILFIMVSVSIFWSGTVVDICNTAIGAATNACLTPSPSGYITAYQGCVNDCTLTAFTFLGNSPLAFLIKGDFVGFITSFIGGTQSSFQLGSTANQCSIFGGLLACVGINLNFWSVVSGIISAATGAILLFLGTGVGFQGNAGAATVNLGGTVSVNDSGTRTFQSLGVALLLWSAVTGFVFSASQWFGYIGFGLGTGAGAAGAAGGALYIFFLLYYTYQAYLQGKTIAS